ncbi:MAG: rod shape-determining protein MreD [Pseudomonadota bacterium]
MTDGGVSWRHLWDGGLALVAGLACILVGIIPIHPGADTYPMPDLLFCLLAYWVLRRPEGASLPLVFVLGLVADLMLGRPVGLATFLLVVMTEILRGQAQALRDVSFVFEWMLFAVLTALMLLGQMLLLWITFSEVPSGSLIVQYGLFTVLSYPLVAVLLGTLLGIRYPVRAAYERSTYLRGG